MRTLPLLLALACAAPEPKSADSGTPPGEPALVCDRSVDLLAAPPPIDTEVGRIAAIDLLTVDADAIVGDDGTVTLSTTLTFLVGEADGRVVFELGPDPESVTLDGDPATLDSVSVSEPVRELRVLDAELDRCSAHTLVVRTTLPVGWLDDGGQARLERYPEGTWWSSGQEDDRPARYLGMWFPTNLLFDRFTLALDLHVPPGHQLASTGDVSTTDDGFRVTWPRPVQSHGPLWVLSPTALTHSLTRTVELTDGPVSIEIHAFAPDDLGEAATRATDALTAFDATYTPYLHGDRYVVWLREDRNSSMEYDGGTVTRLSALEHEIHHSWFARGAAPVADLHGWVDEAITSWATDLLPYRAFEIDFDTDPLLLRIGAGPWAGATLSTETYILGGSLFSGLAAVHGVDVVTDALGAFAAARSDRPYRDEELEAHLDCWLDDPLVHRAFVHIAYGGVDDGAPSDPCP